MNGLGVQALALDKLFRQLCRVDVVGRIHRRGQHLHQELLLCVTLDQRRRCPNLNLEIALDRVVIAVLHHPIEIPLDVRAGHVVVESFGKAAQNAGGVVVLHLHTAKGVRRVTTDSLEHGRHAGHVLGHLQGEVDDVHHLGLNTRDDEGIECSANVGVVRIGLNPPNLARGQRVAATSRGNAVSENDLRRSRQAGVVHHGPGRAVQDALHCPHLACNAHAPRHPGAVLPCQHVIGEFTGIDG